MYQVFERYVALAREAASNGDLVAAENFYQYAEHYFRVYKASRERDPREAPRRTTPDDATMGGSDQGSSEAGT